MARVITFSRTFPSYHPRAGQPTYFVEKLHYAIWAQCSDEWEDAQSMIKALNKHLPNKVVDSFIDSLEMEIGFNDISKNHTVRGGRRWKAGEYFSPRVWSGRPYNSPQIIIGPDVKIENTWDLEIDPCGVMSIAIPGDQLQYLDEDVDELIAKNDGLTHNDFLGWIIMPYYKAAKESGPMQIICWNDSIEY